MLWTPATPGSICVLQASDCPAQFRLFGKLLCLCLTRFSPVSSTFRLVICVLLALAWAPTVTWDIESHLA